MGAALLKPKSYTYKPTAQQWEGLREMTRLLCDRTKSLGVRFNAARAVYQKTFTVEEQEIRNLYEFYYPDDSESKKIAALTQ